jgi:radical SAM superfamily enzyme with C-terminal helix-hairpin-helix motif
MGRSSSPTKDRSNQPGNIYGDKKKSSEPEVTPPGKKKQAQPRAKANKSTQVSEKDQVTGQDGKVLAGQKRKKVQVYKAKTIPMLTAETVHPLDVVVHSDGSAPVVDEFSSADAASNDSNKKRRSETIGSADQAGAVEQPRRTQ